MGTFRLATDLTTANLTPPDVTTPDPIGSAPTAGDNPGVQGNLSAGDHAISAELPSATESSAYANVDSWRVEVAARLERYRTRRKPKSPRYPSLLLPFDAPESWSRPATSTAAAQFAQDFSFDQDRGLATASSPRMNPRIDTGEDTNEDESDFDRAPQPQERHRAAEPQRMPERYSEPAHETFANVIEFPRSAALPVIHRSELAEAIFDRPRIVEAPEVLPPPPALGGMLMEAADLETADARLDLAAPFSSASISRRMLAALVDGAVLLVALAAFGFIFLRWNPAFIAGLISTPNLSQNLIHGPFPIIAGIFAALAIILWIAYEFLFTVYTGSTPGLRAAHLKLTAFDGSPLNRRARRWRVLASFLSAFSAGLGYLWSFLDQDGLCWHDRITHTHVQSSV